MDINFGFLMFENLEELDLVGPWEIITVWSKEFNGPKNVFTISQNSELIQCVHGLKIAADYHFENCPPLDYLLIPGGMGTRTEVNNTDLIQFIAQQARQGCTLVSVCTGTFLLQAAGLLKNRRVTTHWQSLNRLRAFPELTVKEQRFIHDDNIWTSAGISAGIDMAFALIAEIAGSEVAGLVQMQTEYFPSDKRYIDLIGKEDLPEYLKYRPK